MRITPPPVATLNNQPNKQRSSNLELYRIVCMFLIVAHHFATNSGLNAPTGPLQVDPYNIKSIVLRLFGMWGKTGINCFMMITGYYMCASKITIKKYLKLFLEVIFYNVSIYIVFLATGYETLSARSVLKSVMPIWGFEDMFTSCFLAFYLFIPFFSILVNNLTKKQHQILVLLLFLCYSVLGSIPSFNITFNYVTWFGIVFIIASYVRLHPESFFDNKRLWGWMTLGLVIMSILSVVFLNRFIGSGYFLMADSNNLLAVAVAVSSFLWFKNIKLPLSKLINAMGASTFGVLLIHANSSAMRKWLWKDTIDVVGHYTLPLGQLLVFSMCVVLLVYFSCTLIDQARIELFEKPFFKWYDKHLDNKLNDYKDRLLCLKN